MTYNKILKDDEIEKKNQILKLLPTKQTLIKRIGIKFKIK